jgi:hypothetical protein
MEGMRRQIGSNSHLVGRKEKEIEFPGMIGSNSGRNVQNSGTSIINIKTNKKLS